MPEKTFSIELCQLLNRYGLEAGSDTPDFLLADFIESCLSAYNRVVALREELSGRKPYAITMTGGRKTALRFDSIRVFQKEPALMEATFSWRGQDVYTMRANGSFAKGDRFVAHGISGRMPVNFGF